MKLCILMIVLLVFIFLLILFFSKPKKNNVLGYTNINAAYRKPFVIKNLLTPEQCQQIMNYAEGRLFDSEVVGGKNKTVRNSQQTWIQKNNPLVSPIFEKASKMFGIPVENAEHLQVVRYLPNQYYNEHHDSCCDNNDKCEEFVKNGGQRILTVLIYLNNEFTDGQTYFKNLGIKMKPNPGDAIVFYPLANGSNKCHPFALHAGLPVTEGNKWVCNLWFRERKRNV